MKKLLLIISLITIAGTATAQHMVVEKSVGGNEIIALDNLRQITFDGTTVNIEQNDGARSNATMGDISRIYFRDFSTIEDLKKNEDLIEQLPGEKIAINCPAGTVVTIYSITGSLVLSTRIETEGGQISVANIPQGIYIVKANDRTAKFVRR